MKQQQSVFCFLLAVATFSAVYCSLVLSWYYRSNGEAAELDMPRANWKQRTSSRTKSPQLVFIKGIKVGGTSIAYALDQVVRKYGISVVSSFHEIVDSRTREKLPTRNKFSTLIERFQPVREDWVVRNGSIFYSHGFKNRWMTDHLPDVRFVTILRDPVSQMLSFLNYLCNARYFKHYPEDECTNADLVLPISSNSSTFNFSYGFEQIKKCHHVRC